MGENVSHRDNVVSGPITKTIFTLAVPVVFGMFLEFALSSTDYFWVGKLGATAQDAVTSSMVVIWTIFASMAIISVGVTALVSRYVGAKELDRVNFYIKQGLALALTLGLLLTITGYFATPWLQDFMDSSPKTQSHAIPYLRIFFISSTLFFWIETVYAVYRASGDTKTPMWVGIGIVLLNMVLDPLLIFGIGPFPDLGVSGASTATAISALVGAVVITINMHRGGLGYRVPRLFAIRPDIRSMLKIARIGLPIASEGWVFTMVYWFLIKIVHRFGETAGAAMGIGNRMESFSYLTCYGFSLAASTMVGQNLGAKQPERAARCAWGATGLAIGLTLIISVLFITFPRVIASIFTDDPQVLEIAVDYLIILGLSQSAMALEIVLQGSFGGAGDTLPPMLVLVPFSIARIPLAYYLAITLDWGINGVWWTLTITSLIKGGLLAIWFKRGKWKLKQI